MSINWPASTPESRRAAAAALGRLGLSPHPFGISGLAGADPALETNDQFRQVMASGAGGIPFSVDDFIYFAANFPYPKRPWGMRTDVKDISNTRSDTLLKKNANELIFGNAAGTKGTPSGYRWEVHPVSYEDSDKYVPAGRVSALISMMNKSIELRISGDTPNRMSDENGNDGWVWHWLGGQFAAFVVFPVFVQVIGRNPSRGEIADILNGYNGEARATERKISDLSNKIKEEAQKRSNAIASIQASINDIAAIESKAKSQQTEAQTALQSFQSVSAELATLRQGLKGLSGGLGFSWTQFAEDIASQQTTNNSGMILLDLKPQTPTLTVFTDFSAQTAAISSNVNAAAAAADTAVNEINRVVGLISNELRNANAALSKANASSGFKDAEAQDAVARAAKNSASKGEGIVSALRDRVLAEASRIQREFEDLKAKNRQEFVASKRSYFMTLDNKGLRSEYEKIKDDPDTEIVAMLIEIAKSKGLDLLKKALPYAAIIGGLAVVGGAIWWFKFRKA